MSDVAPKDTYSLLLQLIEDVTEEPADGIGRETNLEGLGNWSSLAALRLFCGVEKNLGVALDLRDYLSIQTVGELDDAVREAQT